MDRSSEPHMSLKVNIFYHFFYDTFFNNKKAQKKSQKRVYGNGRKFLP